MPSCCPQAFLQGATLPGPMPPTPCGSLTCQLPMSWPPPLCLGFHCPCLANPRHTQSRPPISCSPAPLTVQMATVIPWPSLDGQPRCPAAAVWSALPHSAVSSHLCPQPHGPPSQKTQEPPYGQESVASPNPKPASLTPTSFHSYHRLCQPPLCLLLLLPRPPRSVFSSPVILAIRGKRTLSP